MLKIYIAQPMQFMSDSDIQAVREDVEEWIRTVRHPNAEIEFINNYHEEWADIPALEALGKSMEMLANADLAYFAPGWENSRGCQIEAACCDLYNIPWTVVGQ